jgi:cyclophilin family peptidyl-prolyl cis-trans isomerase/HEAT repeat protein
MHLNRSTRIATAAFLLASTFAVAAQRRAAPNVSSRIATPVLLQIIRAEDERHWDSTLQKLLSDQNPQVRKRAALAAGRIGNEAAVPVLAEMLLTDHDTDVRQITAFALGEIESPGGAYALTEVLKKKGEENGVVRARAVEALGKIVAAMSSSTPADAREKAADDDRLDIIKAAIVDTLRFEDSRRSQSDRLTILLGLTSVLRAKPDGVGKLLARFLDYSDSRIVADALNTLARLKLKDGNDEALALLVKHADPIVRANAARVLGVTEDKQAFDALLDRALHDQDLRVRVSAIRALGLLKDARATKPLLDRARQLTAGSNALAQQNEILELATTLGAINQKNPTPQVELLNWLASTGDALGHTAVEVEIASARVSPQNFIVLASTDKFAVRMMLTNWRAASRLAQGLGEIAELTKGESSPSARGAVEILRAMLDYRNSGIKIYTLVAVHTEYAIPDVLQAFAAFKPKDLSEVARPSLNDSDVIVQATAAELLGREPSDANTRALIAALPRAMRDVDNDAALAILDALAKQKNKEANDAVKTALDSKDHLIRRRAVALLKVNGVGDFSDRIGTVQTRNTEADYRRAIARIGRKPTATVVTSKGSFTIEFLPEDAPLTVDNFIQLAKRGYFNGQAIPRVVPNFVVQAGDPRGDTNGGPGYTIRCEINEVPYERAAVGMALSGKDTGGSQWFVTHSPQPHLDGGYTVFGRVIRGMEVVDNIARGDRIVRFVVSDR